MNNIIRTFIAISVPNRVLDIRDMVMTTVDDPKGRINWVKKGRIHLTLKFLGATPEESIPEINSIIADSLKGISFPTYQIKGTGCFPDPDRPRIIWLGVDGDLDPLKNYINILDDKLDKIGFLKEDKDYIPHLTLGRVKYPPKTAPGISTFLNTVYEPVNMRCDRVYLMSSVLQASGPVYSILGTHELNNKG